MALNNMGLGFVFTAKDLASGVMRKLDRNFRDLDDVSEDTSTRVAKHFGHMATGVAAMATGGAILSALSGIATVSGEFEAAVRSAGLIAGADAKQLKAFEEAAIAAGIATQFSPTEAVKGLEALSSAGLNAKDSLTALNPTLQLAGASLGQLSVEDAGGLAVQALNIFELKAEQTGETVHKLTQLANQSSVSFGNMTLGLGNIARGAKAMHQSLDESLITLGLVKGVIPRIDSAATAASVAMERIVDPKHQGKIKAMGVEVADGEGKFRDFLDIVVDMQGAMADMDETTKSAALLSIFGQEGLAGVQAVMGALDKGIEDVNGNLLKGADAVAELRAKMKGAADAEVAKTFNDEMLKTFEGQKKLLRGSMETLAIVVGKPLIEVFAPIVKFVTEKLQALAKFIKGMSPEAQKWVARIVAGGAALMGVVGAVIALKSALMILRFSGLGSIAPLLSALGPFLPVLLAVGAAVLALKVAWDENFGGIQEAVFRAWDVIKLFAEGLFQLFSQGGFSGEVQKALGAPENAGLKEFLIDIYQVAYRVYRFFLGFWEGFKTAITTAKPTFLAFGVALSKVWAIVQKLGEALFGVGDSIPSSDFASFGAWLGGSFARVLTHIVEVVGTLIDLWATYALAFIGAIDNARPYLEYLWAAVLNVWDALKKLIEAIFGVDEASTDWGTTFQWLGETVGWLAGLVAGGLGVALDIVAVQLRIIAYVIKGVVAAFAWVAEKLEWIVDKIFWSSNEAEQASKKILGVSKSIGVQIATDVVMANVDRSTAAPATTSSPGLSRFKTDLDSLDLGKLLSAKPVAPTPKSSTKLSPRAPSLQSVVTDESGTVKIPTTDIMGGLPAARAGAKTTSTKDMKSALSDALKESGIKDVTTTVILQLDGEQLAKAQIKAKRGDDARTFRNVAPSD